MQGSESGLRLGLGFRSRIGAKVPPKQGLEPCVGPGCGLTLGVGLASGSAVSSRPGLSRALTAWPAPGLIPELDLGLDAEGDGRPFGCILKYVVFLSGATCFPDMNSDP